MSPATRFTDPAAVEAWDAWFRWRDGEGLRDRTIDSTWSRIAESIATVEGPQARAWARRWEDAFSRWQLLPDERLLREAGTGLPIHSHEPLHAQLNVAAFVTGTNTKRMHLQLDSLADTAAAAMRLLDDAWMAMPASEAHARVRIGVLGMADALAALELSYDSLHACQMARDVAEALATGALRGAVELARERGGAAFDEVVHAAVCRERHTPPELVGDAVRWGVRHVQVTVIAPHPRLAALANNVADALDPHSDPRPSMLGGTGRARTMGFPPVPLSAQVRLRGAMQPWIDAPIDYPLASRAEPGPDERERLDRLAETYRLPSPRFRHIVPAGPQGLIAAREGWASGAVEGNPG